MRAIHLAVAIAAGLLPAAALAQDYPSRPVLFVNPYASGGGTETMARLLGRKLEQRLGKPFVIESRPGAGTSIGATFVAKSPPDGHTILLATSTTMAINVSIYKSLSYDPAKDLTPVALFSDVPFILAVNPALPVHSIDDLVKLAKSTPGGLAYASNGHGGAGHLYAELLKSMAGIEMTHVPYKGLAPALNDVVAGHVALTFGDFGTALPLVKAGRLRALGVTTKDRVGAAPEIPPLNEAGLPGYVASSWQMVAAPAGIPRPILDKLNGELRAILAEPDVREDFINRGVVPVVSPLPDELQHFVRTEIVRWSKVVEQAGAAGSQ
ncbi:MAG TPA: tripartite tricarboxylate transporter substrate binding protein [Xanthobacteraceae bacterium]|nr:tripartite tricarboxylate transporter substrate binding protein [Xanthobacteraceae bacterium]